MYHRTHCDIVENCIVVHGLRVDTHEDILAFMGGTKKETDSIEWVFDIQEKDLVYSWINSVYPKLEDVKILYDVPSTLKRALALEKRIRRYIEKYSKECDLPVKQRIRENIEFQKLTLYMAIIRIKNIYNLNMYISNQPKPKRASKKTVYQVWMADNRAPVTRDYIECNDTTIREILKKKWESVKYNEPDTYKTYEDLTKRINEGVEDMPNHLEMDKNTKHIQHQAFLLFMKDTQSLEKYGKEFYRGYAASDWYKLDDETRMKYIKHALKY